MRLALDEADLSSPAGRDRALDEVVPVLAAMRESISRNELARLVGDRLDADERRALFHLSGLETRNFGLMPPRVTLREPLMAAGRETEDDEGADEIPGHSARHARRMREIPLRILQGRS